MYRPLFGRHFNSCVLAFSPPLFWPSRLSTTAPRNSTVAIVLPLEILNSTLSLSLLSKFYCLPLRISTTTPSIINRPTHGRSIILSICRNTLIPQLQTLSPCRPLQPIPAPTRSLFFPPGLQPRTKQKHPPPWCFYGVVTSSTPVRWPPVSNIRPRRFARFPHLVSDLSLLGFRHIVNGLLFQLSAHKTIITQFHHRSW